MKTILIAAVAAMLLPAAAPAATLPPRDECAADASFAAFRTMLKGIVQRKDGKALLAIAAPDIEWSFGEAPGRAAFAKEWALDRPAQSKIWAELDAMLSLGCALDKAEASIPYSYARLPDRDASEVVLLKRPRVNLRAGPGTDAAVVALLDWEILTLIDEKDGWTHVRTDQGKEGYVRNDFVTTPYDFRALFTKRAGKWVMTALINGD